MNIEKIKCRVDLFVGRKMNFQFNGARNQIDEFIGVIENTYPSIFTVRVVDNNSIKSYSYSDVLIHKLIIKE